MNALPESFRVVPGTIIGILVAWDFLADHANKAAVLRSIGRECNEAEVELAHSGGRCRPIQSTMRKRGERSRSWLDA